MLAQTHPSTVALTDFLVSLIPWAVIFLFAWVLASRMTRRQTRQIERGMDQRREIQEKLDRIIVLLEERNRGA